MAGFNDDLIKEIENRLDIVDVIGETCELTRKGNRYWGLCPFHTEKTPSFSVSQDKQLFYCFGCHEGGNIFTFIMRYHSLDFGEAVQFLAEKAGLDVPRFVPSAKGLKPDKGRLILDINREAARFYHELLKSHQGQEAMTYLYGRGVSDESIERFFLGYAPDDWRRLQEYLLKKGFPIDAMLEAGLIRRSQKGDLYMDFFRHRIIFPIFSQSKQVIGFGGRLQSGEGPKYLNSPENQVFSKRQNLFGLLQGRDHIRANNHVILVEGYMDCLQLHQYGVGEAVATLGTAFTREQARLVKRLAQDITIMYDGDSAGQRETLRALAIIQEEGLNPYIVTLPANMDPDELIQKHGKEEFLKFIQNNRGTALEYKLENLTKNDLLPSFEEKLRILWNLFPEVQRSESTLMRDRQIGFLARRLELTERDVSREFAAWTKGRKSAGSIRNRNLINRNNRKHLESQEKPRNEERLLGMMIADPALFEYVKNELGLDFFSDPLLKRLVAIGDQVQSVEPQEFRAFFEKAVFEEQELQALWARINLLVEERPLSRQEVELFLQTRRVQQERSRWQNFAGEVKALEANGEFYAALRCIIALAEMSYKEARKEG